MTDRSRLDALKRMGLNALQGLKTVVAGVDVIIDPNAPAQAGEEDGGGTETEAGPRSIGTDIGRRALEASAHRIGVAERTELAAEPGGAGAVAAVGLTLSAYPGPGVALLEQALGLPADLLPPDGDLEVEATARDLAWLPLSMGREFCGRAAGSRLLAVGGYHRAALVRFSDAAPRFPGVWCCLGEEELGAGLDLLQESTQGLIRAAGAGQVGLALLGGAALEAALWLPDAVLERELTPDPALGLIPVWGLFTSGRTVAVAPADDDAVKLVPVGEVEL